MKNQAAPACRGSVAQACKSVGRVWLIALLCFAHFAAWHAVATADAKSLPFQEISNAAPPALEAVDLDGSHIALDGFVGKTVLVHFFATWCEPCRPELASLSELKAKHSDAIEILAVSVAEPRVRLQRFFEKNPVNFPVVMDADRSTSQAWGVDMLPTTFVLDPTGAVRLKVEGDLDWSQPNVVARLEELKEVRPNQPTQ